MVAEPVRRDPAALLALLAAERVEAIYLPFVALQQLAEVAAEGGSAGPERQRVEAPSSLTDLVTAGEQLRVTPQLRALLGRLPGCRLHNHYGPSETHVVTAWSWPPAAGPGAAEPPALPPIGRPVGNAAARVVDMRLRPAPPGIPGELVVGGDCLARGYLGRPALTAERFVPDPFGPPGARLYRTGDRARALGDGELEFLGRIDQQVKIRGFRVEPGEIEAALVRHPSVAEAAVVARGEGGERRLVAYLERRAGAPEPTAAALRDHLRATLPDYMVPAGFAVVDRLPQTPSGKVDRRRLAMEGPLPEGAAEVGFVPPRNHLEEVIAGIWAQMLDRRRVGSADSFFELGGHSLLATRVLSRLGRAFGVEVPLKTLFEAPTVAGLAAEVERLLQRGAGLEAPPIEPVRRDRPLPLSFAQQRLWFIERLAPDTAIYNVPTAVRLDGRLDRTALGAALAAVVDRHETLRTTFAETDEGAIQVVGARRGAAMPLVDLTAIPAGRREPEALRVQAADAVRGFDLVTGPLFRAALVRLDAADHLALLNTHHIVSDGWSMGVLIGELSALYRAFVAGRPSPLPELPVQYADFAVWQRRWLAGEALDRQLDYWRRALDGAIEPLELPTDRPRPATQSFAGDTRSSLLPAALVGRLRALARRLGASLFMTLLAGFEALLHRYTGQRRFSVGSPIANRNRTEIEGLIGFFVNTLALPAAVDPDLRFEELVERARDASLGAFAHQDLPFERLVGELASDRDPSRSPVFQVMYVLQNAGPALHQCRPGSGQAPAGDRHCHGDAPRRPDRHQQGAQDPRADRHHHRAGDRAGGGRRRPRRPLARRRGDGDGSRLRAGQHRAGSGRQPGGHGCRLQKRGGSRPRGVPGRPGRNAPAGRSVEPADGLFARLNLTGPTGQTGPTNIEGFYDLSRHPQPIRLPRRSRPHRGKNPRRRGTGARRAAAAPRRLPGTVVTGGGRLHRADGAAGAPPDRTALRQDHPALRPALSLQRMHQRLPLLRLQRPQQGAAADPHPR
jgi:acyl carrier protein